MRRLFIDSIRVSLGRYFVRPSQIKPMLCGKKGFRINTSETNVFDCPTDSCIGALVQKQMLLTTIGRAVPTGPRPLAIKGQVHRLGCFTRYVIGRLFPAVRLEVAPAFDFLPLDAAGRRKGRNQ